jgi:hypothetical protein
MAFLEELPPACPPNGAADASFAKVWRVVNGENPTVQDFMSNAFKGWPKRPTDTDCEHSSCSLFTDETLIKALAKRMPKLRYPDPYIAALSIPEGAGMSLVGGPHIHLWMYDSFNPVAHVLSTEAP